MTEQLAVRSSRRPWPAVAILLAALVAAISITATSLEHALSGDEEITSDAASPSGCASPRGREEARREHVHQPGRLRRAAAIALRVRRGTLCASSE